VTEELIDTRAKVSAMTHKVMTAVELATGKTHSEIVRDVMGKWAEAKIHEAMVIARLTRCEGNTKDSEGNT
jgi:ABC-type phosphate transport system permease subunit